MFGMFGPKTKEDAIKKILKYKSEPTMYSGVVPYEKEIRQLKDKFSIDDGEIKQARKKVKEKEEERIRRDREEEGEVLLGGKKCRKSRKSKKLRKSRKPRKSRKSRKSRKMRGKGCGCGRMNCPYCVGRRSCRCPYRR